MLSPSSLTSIAGSTVADSAATATYWCCRHNGGCAISRDCKLNLAKRNINQNKNDNNDDE